MPNPGELSGCTCFASCCMQHMDTQGNGHPCGAMWSEVTAAYAEQGRACNEHVCVMCNE